MANLNWIKMIFVKQKWSIISILDPVVPSKSILKKSSSAEVKETTPVQDGLQNKENGANQRESRAQNKENAAQQEDAQNKENAAPRSSSLRRSNRSAAKLANESINIQSMENKRRLLNLFHLKYIKMHCLIFFKKVKYFWRNKIHFCDKAEEKFKTKYWKV